MNQKNRMSSSAIRMRKVRNKLRDNEELYEKKQSNGSKRKLMLLMEGSFIA